VRIDVRWGAGNADSFCKQAAEFVSLAPDVLFVSGMRTIIGTESVSKP
jgi:hypothetical protein